MEATWKADDGSIFFSDGTWIRIGDRLKAEVVVSKHAAEVDARDEVIGRLLAMLEPGSGQLGRIEDDKTISLTIAEWNLLVTAHARACEIAGRTE